MKLDMWGISCFLLHIIQVDTLIDCFKMWPVLFIVNYLTYNSLLDCCFLILFFASFAFLFLPSLLLHSLSQTHMHTYTYTHLLSDFEHFVGQRLSLTLCNPSGLQHSRLPCPSLSPVVYSNSCPFSWWCHPTISSSVSPFSSWPQSYPASRSFLVNWLFTSGGQSIGASASASFLPMYI